MLLALTACSEALPDSVDLGVEMVPQQASQWCWAASAAAIANWRGMNVTQGDVVSYSFDRECRASALGIAEAPRFDSCNAPFNPSKYLVGAAGMSMPGYTYRMSTADFWRQKLSDGVPLIIYLKNATGGHYMIVSGFTAEGFTVLDPAAAIGGKPQTLTLEQLHDYGATHLEIVEAATMFIGAE